MQPPAVSGVVSAQVLLFWQAHLKGTLLFPGMPGASYASFITNQLSTADTNSIFELSPTCNTYDNLQGPIFGINKTWRMKTAQLCI